MELSAVPVEELAKALQERRGVAVLMGWVDLTEPLGSNSQRWRVISSPCAYPILHGLVVTIEHEMDALRQEYFHVGPNGEDTDA